MTRTAAARPVPTLFAALLAGCGYTFGAGLDQHGVRTVALRVVGNESYRQRLEAELSAALARALPVRSGLRLATADTADAELQVVVTNARERTLVPGTREDPVREGAFEAGVRLRLVRRDGAVVVDRTLRDRAEFRSPIGEDLTSARAELVDDLANRIALALESDF